MKKYKYIIVLLLLFFSFNIKVFASENYNTTYNITIPDYDLILDNYNDGNITLTQFIHNFIDNTDFENAGYNLFITMDSSHMYFYLTPKSYTLNYYSMYGNSTRVMQKYINCINCSNYSYGYTFNISSFDSDIISNNTSWFNFISALNNGTIPTQTIDSYGSLYSGGIPSFQVPYYSNDSYYYTSVNNNDNIDVFDLYYYFSSVDLVYNNSYLLEDSSYYFKNLHIINNDITYNVNDSLPSYYDLNNSSDNNVSQIDYLNSLGTFYTNFSPSDISNFDVDITFNTSSITALQYNQNLSYTWGCYGRIFHSNLNYYTYEKFSSCDFENLGDFSPDSNNLNINFQNLTIYNNYGQAITNFNIYDKLYFYVDFQYNNDSLDKTLFNLVYSSNGNIIYTKNFNGPIYENFDNLPLYFKILLSTSKGDYSNFSVRYSGSTLTNKYFIYKQQYNLSNLQTIGNISLLGTNFQNLSVNRNISLGYMFYQQISDINSGIDIPSLEFIFNDNILVSFNNSSSNDFYYYDSDGNISNSTFSINYENTSDTSFNLDYYFQKVIDFENSIANKINILHDTIQDLYDVFPVYFQSVIFMLFIVLCAYVLFKEIRR